MKVLCLEASSHGTWWYSWMELGWWLLTVRPVSTMKDVNSSHSMDPSPLTSICANSSHRLATSCSSDRLRSREFSSVSGEVCTNRIMTNTNSEMDSPRPFCWNSTRSELTLSMSIIIMMSMVNPFSGSLSYGRGSASWIALVDTTPHAVA